MFHSKCTRLSTIHEKRDIHLRVLIPKNPIKSKKKKKLYISLEQLAIQYQIYTDKSYRINIHPKRKYLSIFLPFRYPSHHLILSNRFPSSTHVDIHYACNRN